VLLGVLAHIQLDHRVLVAEQELRQRLGQFGLTDTGRTGEDERAAGPLGILQAARVRRIERDSAFTASCWPM
jgi:hypothetical protein